MPAPSVALQQWRLAGRRVLLGGHALFVRRSAGPRTRLLLLHGFPSASFDWDPLWPQLAQRFSLVAPDLLGLGLSAKPARCAYSVALQANLIESLLQQEGWTDGSVHVLAHDLGVTITQELLARQLAGRPMLASVVFLNGGLFPEAHHARPIQRLLARPLLGSLLARLLGSRSFHRAMRGIAGAQPPPTAMLDDLWWLLASNHGRLRLPALLGYLGERWQFRERWVGALISAAETIPLRLVCGMADPISGADMATRYEQLVPGADVVRLPGVGHFPQLEAPEAVLAAVLAFHHRQPSNGQN